MMNTKDIDKCHGGMMTVCQYYGEKGMLLQALNWRMYKSTQLYYYTYNIRLWKLIYKSLQ